MRMRQRGKAERDGIVGVCLLRNNVGEVLFSFSRTLDLEESSEAAPLAIHQQADYSNKDLWATLSLKNALS